MEVGEGLGEGGLEGELEWAVGGQLAGWRVVGMWRVEDRVGREVVLVVEEVGFLRREVRVREGVLGLEEVWEAEERGEVRNSKRNVKLRRKDGMAETDL